VARDSWTGGRRLARFAHRDRIGVPGGNRWIPAFAGMTNRKIRVEDSPWPQCLRGEPSARWWAEPTLPLPPDHRFLWRADVGLYAFFVLRPLGVVARDR